MSKNDIKTVHNIWAFMCWKHKKDGIHVYEGWLKDLDLFYNDLNREIGKKPTPSHTIWLKNHELGFVPYNLKWIKRGSWNDGKTKANKAAANHEAA